MKIAVMSDIHDNVWNLEAALRGIQEAEALVCCGDLCSPFVVTLLGQGFALRPIYIIFGNNDGDAFRITQNAARFPNIQIKAEFLEAELGGRRIAAVHYNTIAAGLAASGRYDAVFFGHNHRFEIRREGAALMVNPGTLMGWDPSAPEGGRSITATFAVYDTASGQAEGFRVGPPHGHTAAGLEISPV